MSKKLYEKMNLYLANQEVAYIKLHNLHWYVKGRSFFTLHAKLEELYDQTAEIIDAVAERLLAVGQAPVANMKEALALATIKELAETIEKETGKKMSRQNLTQRLGRDNFQEQDMRMIAKILECPFYLDILEEHEEHEAVSYTHLTLPTILRV